VTLYFDPADPMLLGQPFDNEGVPVGRIVWIDKGILRNLAYARFWAQKQGKQPTSGAAAGGLAHPGHAFVLHPFARDADRAQYRLARDGGRLMPALRISRFRRILRRGLRRSLPNRSGPPHADHTRVSLSAGDLRIE
jgi:hypothetical protein